MEIKIEGNKVTCQKCGHVTVWSYDPKTQTHTGARCKKCNEDLLKEVEILPKHYLH